MTAQSNEPSRRAFFRSSGKMIGGAWLTVQLPAVLAISDLACQAHRDGATFLSLNNVEALEIEAISAQIIPTDDSPGAREAGIVYFIDRAMTDLVSDEDARTIRDGLAQLSSLVSEQYPTMGRFSSLSEKDQVAYLKSIEHSDFFREIRDLTITGMFAHPKYGGNKNKAGWALLGFEDQNVWQPPFGYYDAQYAAESKSNGRVK